MTKKELHDGFAEGWVLESVEPSRYEVRPEGLVVLGGRAEGMVRGGEAGVRLTNLRYGDEARRIFQEVLSDFWIF